jgi:hypothetical protein
MFDKLPSYQREVFFGSLKGSKILSNHAHPVLMRAGYETGRRKDEKRTTDTGTDNGGEAIKKREAPNASP